LVIGRLHLDIIIPAVLGSGRAVSGLEGNFCLLKIQRC
jgi:hypothetical protein